MFFALANDTSLTQDMLAERFINFVLICVIVVRVIFVIHVIVVIGVIVVKRIIIIIIDLAKLKY
jgi:hypothetical protein